MVFPAGGMGFMQPQVDRAPPQVIKDVHAKYWWMLFLLMIAVIVLEVLSLRTFDAIFVGVLAFILWYQVRNNCMQMSQMCLMFLGLLCLIHAIFQIITLISSLSGRRTSHSTKHSIGNHEVAYTTKVESHPFFDPSQGFTYNMQSATCIVSPIVMVAAVYMAYWSYSAFNSAMFGGDDADEAGYGGGFGGMGGQGLAPQYGANRQGGFYNGNGNRFDEPTAQANSMRRGAGMPPRLFEGSGRRLNDDT